MTQDKSSNLHTHDASDRALDKLATEEQQEQQDRKSAGGPRHDPTEIRQHDDTGRDRLFEDRQQHDEADKNQDKNRLARDVQRHGHDVDEQVPDTGSGPSAKRKN